MAPNVAPSSERLAIHYSIRESFFTSVVRTCAGNSEAAEAILQPRDRIEDDLLRLIGIVGVIFVKTQSPECDFPTILRPADSGIVSDILIVLRRDHIQSITTDKSA